MQKSETKHFDPPASHYEHIRCSGLGRCGVSHRSLWLLLHHQYWASPKLPSGILLLPQSWRSCRCGSTGPVLSHAPAGHRLGRCWGGLDVGLDGS